MARRRLVLRDGDSFTSEARAAMLATFSQLRKRGKCRQEDERYQDEKFSLRMLLTPTASRLTPIENLALFWRETYPKLKQQLLRKYPKHDWR
jgi:hypothetical protein